MRWRVAISSAWLTLVAGGIGWAADPLTRRSGSAETLAGDGPSGLFMRLAGIQHELNERISTAFAAVRDHHSGRALALILGLAFFYGALHAIGPGHGKAVVASYFVGRRARWTSGVMMGSLVSLIQGVSAVVLVGLLAVVLQWRQFDVLHHSTLVELVSYGLIALMGIAMLFRALTGRGHGHHHHDHDGHAHGAESNAPLDRKLILATGLTPCASAIILLLFALANEAFGVGVAAVAALSLGMALTVSTIGVLSVLGRHALLHVIERVGIRSHQIEHGLTLLGAVVIVGASSLLMLDAWWRL